jgi:hypothetical protein
MFKAVLDTDFFTYILKEASEKFIKNDRLQYKPIFDLIRQELIDDTTYKNSISKDSVIFSDVSKINQSNLNTLDDETDMTIYTINARKIATRITNIIHKMYGKFVQMRSIIPNEEYDIMVNMRNLIKIYRIERYKNIKLNTLFNTVNINGLLYFPIEVELIDIYRKLYLPNFNEEWISIYKDENILYKQLQSKKIGGVESKCIKCPQQRTIDIYQIKLLLLDFFNGENYVMVGNWAHIILDKESLIDDIGPSSGNLQIISENNINQDYSNISDYLSKFTQYGIYFKKKLLYIPKDNRIHRYTFFIKYPTFGKIIVDKQFLDIYNCGSYELIPYINIKNKGSNLKVGNIFIQMRFLLIDLWLINLMKQIQGVSDDVFNTKLDYIFSTMTLVKKIMPDGFKNSSLNYIGINFDEKIAQKLEISEKQIKRSSYYPELSIKKDKKYKLVATS